MKDRICAHALKMNHLNSKFEHELNVMKMHYFRNSLNRKNKINKEIVFSLSKIQDTHKLAVL